MKILEELGGGNFSSELRFGRKLSVIRGIVEQEIQAMVSRRENAATHHLYQAWDPVPSLAPATTGSRGSWGGWVVWGCQPLLVPVSTAGLSQRQGGGSVGTLSATTNTPAFAAQPTASSRSVWFVMEKK